MIRNGDFDNQSLISENALSKRLNMSRTPVRSAVEKLNLEGFLQIIPNQGILFMEPSIEELKHSYEIRIALEEFVMRELISQILSSDIKGLECALEAQHKAVTNNEPLTFLKLDREFHMFFLEKYANHMILKVVGNVRDRIEKITFQMFKIPGSMLSGYEEHCRIVKAIKAGNRELAVAELGKHLRRVQLAYMWTR